jgi:putative phage-type endonuclease
MLTNDEREKRKRYIGGTDVSAILGMSPWRTPWDVWASKTGRAEDVRTSEAMRWGTALEPVVLAEYEFQTKTKLDLPGFVLDKNTPFFCANLDGARLKDRIIVEAKTANIRKAHEWGEEGTDQVPDAYRLQVMHYMHVLDFDEAHIPVLIGGSDFRIYVVKRDKEAEASIVKYL